MALRIYFMRDLSDPQSDHWTFYPAPDDLDAAMQRARDLYCIFPAANGFKIVNRAGEVLMQEQRSAQVRLKMGQSRAAHG